MLSYTRTIHTIDAHTGGEPLRILVSGMPPVPGATILDKRAWLKANRDDLRQFLMTFVNGSIVGSSVEVRVTDTLQVGAIDAAITEVSGHAHIAGFNQWVLEDSDPFPTGFFLR
ncbi:MULTISPECIES: proline racemase family protein [unclassified Janthinobacterium]|uniref:proline racemase family protein n=1 Tax=unclassified Janthinobacterium TaxID=2610881 RepID=UPI00034628BB|nr:MULTISPECIES: proline racemase family protein [unclassified Janthinobacterium]MEC5162844.1 proline racemase [Janthinobacterium sp. CG_S6]